MQVKVLWCFIGAFVLTCACRGKEDRRSASLTVALTGDVISLDPAAASDSESMQVTLQIFDQLVRYGETSTDIEPSLAKRWKVSKDGKTWTFYLRRDVRFHDGTPMDADAVVFSFERQRNHEHPYHYGGFIYWESMFRQVRSVEKIDRYTVQFKLDRPYAPFLANMALFPTSIVSPAAMKRFGRKFSQWPIGTGPFRFMRWHKGKRIILSRNPDYWDSPPKVEHLVYEVITEADRRFVSLQSGTVDVVQGLDPAHRHIVRLHPDLKLYRMPGNNVAYLAMNTQRPPFDNVIVRRAVNMAIDKRAIVKLAYQGLAVEAHGPIPPLMWSHNHNVRRYRYHPAQAYKMLVSVNYDFSRRIRFHIMSTSRPYLPNPLLVGRIIARNLSMIGIKVDLVIRPFKIHQRSTQLGEHDLCLAGWSGDNNDPDNFLYVLLDRDNARHGAARNLSMFSNDRLHDLLILAQQGLDRQTRERYYRQAQEIVAEEAPWVPIAHTNVVVATRRVIRNLYVHPSIAIYYRKVVKD